MLLDYGLFRARRVLGLAVPNPIRIAGMTIHYGDAELFEQLFHEIFIDRIYSFPGAPTALRIIDAGANIGLATLFFSREYPDAQIDCFEPNPEAFALLERNIAANRVRATAHRVAVGAKDGEGEFFYLPGVTGDCYSSLRELREEFHPNGRFRSRQIQVQSLRPFLEKPVDILKVDIEGGEGEVLPNVAEQLPQVRNLVMEFHPLRGAALLGDMLNLLDKGGHRYEVEQASNRSASGSLVRSTGP